MCEVLVIILPSQVIGILLPLWMIILGSHGFYLLKDRSSVLIVFQTFHSEINTQFSSNIRVLRSVIVLEYMKSDFSNFCSSNGIIH